MEKYGIFAALIYVTDAEENAVSDMYYFPTEKKREYNSKIK